MFYKTNIQENIINVTLKDGSTANVKTVIDPDKHTFAMLKGLLTEIVAKERKTATHLLAPVETFHLVGRL